VTRTRASRLSELALALPCLAASVGCAATTESGDARYGAAGVALHPDEPGRAGGRGGDADQKPPRRPDGVVLEVATALPEPLLRSEASGVIALHPPFGNGVVRELVSELMAAWTSESIERLSALLTDDAGPLDARSRGRAVLVESWRQRLHAHEYHRLAGSELVRPERIERYASGELSTLRGGPKPPELSDDELFVRLPLEVTHLAGERVFGDSILLVLRRDDAKYKIAAYGEP
jgi:hypothetical protein